MDEKGYYVRTEQYLPILERKEELGTFPVPMVNTAVLIDARKRLSRRLTFDPVEVEDSVTADGRHTIPYDDIIAFAKSAHAAGIELYIDNRHVYGYIPPPLSSDSGKEDAQLRQTLLELQLEALIEGRPFPVASTLQAYIEPVHEGEHERLGVDAVYVINLRRRPERRRRMQATLALLNIKATFWDATDGKVLSEEYLERHRISSLEGYLDPYHQRPMTFGEIGCFLSHYRIWEEAKRKNYSAIIILEDDVRFERNFRAKWATAWARFEELQSKKRGAQYDFLYLGRKLNGDPASEETVDSTFVRPGYSYWTIGYLVTRSGIEKLLGASPLGRMIPVDEYLPLLYGSHPNLTLGEVYSSGGTDRRVQRLNALSLKQLIISPTHYVGDAAYISDTEQSNEVHSKKSQPNEVGEEELEEVEEEVMKEGRIDVSGSSNSGGGLQPPPPSSSLSSIEHFEL
ncbi:PREDICTED: glycosyltransferase 25 family member-like [Rhagoletis zephyria]|uniref:glycosyltransferase 25 family member-like n=1 Tax=Rhagoletis zephyria TaxID=28612 RepID=UPI00081165D4|nr:PREDICTED: glycosyltransferase 25 family member-like [Rhagoletis zephyria]